ncbi:MAG: hypothetical protein KGL39_24400 [Patescibacteria group bacterium]|nr:hypothetical protein [Patescibacteria group bacterium]
MAVELNNSTSANWSETDSSNTSAAPDGAPSGTYVNQAEGLFRGIMATVKRAWDRANGAYTVGGTANAITLTSSNATYPSALVAGEVYSFKATSTNTGATTLAIYNTTGIVGAAKSLYVPSASGPVACVGGEVQSGQWVSVQYDGTQFQIVGGNSGYASLNSPAFTGTPSLPTGTTGVTQSSLDNSTKLATTAYADAAGGGVGGPSQGYTDETSSRALNTVYTNSTGRSIYVSAVVNISNSSSATLVVGSVNTSAIASSITGTISGVVAAGATYEVSTTGTVSLTRWVEDR